jgi:hypothetical protein
MNVDAFLAVNPCIDEIEGYVLAARWQDPPIVLSDDDRHKLKVREVELMKGRRTPCNSSLKRTWIYRAGKPAEKIVERFIAVADEPSPDLLED